MIFQKVFCHLKRKCKKCVLIPWSVLCSRASISIYQLFQHHPWRQYIKTMQACYCITLFSIVLSSRAMRHDMSMVSTPHMETMQACYCITMYYNVLYVIVLSSRAMRYYMSVVTTPRMETIQACYCITIYCMLLFFLPGLWGMGCRWFQHHAWKQYV